MTATELAMTQWDDIEAVHTKDGKKHTGEFFLSKHGYLICEKEDGTDTNISLENIKFTDHK